MWTTLAGASDAYVMRQWPVTARVRDRVRAPTRRPGRDLRPRPNDVHQYNFATHSTCFMIPAVIHIVAEKHPQYAGSGMKP